MDRAAVLFGTVERLIRQFQKILRTDIVGASGKTEAQRERQWNILRLVREESVLDLLADGHGTVQISV